MEQRINLRDFKSNWNDVKRRLKDKYPHLSERDLEYTEDEEIFVGRIQSRLGGQKRKDIIETIKSL